MRRQCGEPERGRGAGGGRGVRVAADVRRRHAAAVAGLNVRLTPSARVGTRLVVYGPLLVPPAAHTARPRSCIDRLRQPVLGPALGLGRACIYTFPVNKTNQNSLNRRLAGRGRP